MQINYNTKCKHLTEKERHLIEKWKKEGKSNREIARLLGKSHQTINNESNVVPSIYRILTVVSNIPLKKHKSTIITYDWQSEKLTLGLSKKNRLFAKKSN